MTILIKESKRCLVKSHFFIEVSFVNFWFECAVRILKLYFRLWLPVKNGNSFLLFFGEKNFLAFAVNQGPEGIFIFCFFHLLALFGFNVFLFVLYPKVHLVVVLFSRSHVLLVVFLFYFLHVAIVLLPKLFILFLLILLFQSFVIFLSFLFLLKYFVASDVNGLVMELADYFFGMIVD